MKYIKTYKLYENENNTEVELAGKYSFNLFLDIIDKFDNQFTKQKYLNTGDYSYFFTTDNIKKNMELIHEFELKQSLQTAYLTLKSIKDERLSFYFAVKNDKLEYGFFNDVKMLVYKVGMFKINDRYLKNIKHDCLLALKHTFENTNLSNLSKIQLVKKDLKSFWPELEGDIEILDEKRIKKTFEIKHFKQEDLDEYRMSYTLEKWSSKFDWNKYFTYYSRISDKYVTMFIKIKEKDIQIYNL